ncbi:MAG: hypothetical protein CME70_06260 [Halobacteriovorax sp.]|nr:hypothetical protein [Halobacteriovorax sp.]
MLDRLAAKSTKFSGTDTRISSSTISIGLNDFLENLVKYSDKCLGKCLFKRYDKFLPLRSHTQQ